MLKYYFLINLISKRTIKTVSREIRPKLDSSIEIGNFQQYKKHPGKFMLNYIEVPNELEDVINKILSDQTTRFQKEEIKRFKSYLHDRRTPIENNQIYEVKRKILQENDLTKPFKSSPQIPTKETDQLDKYIELRVKSRIHNSLAINYDHRMSLLYMATRFAPNYSIAKQIFHEIYKRDPNFSPKYLFDFGSGLGTVMWAARSIWKDEIIEYTNHDTSSFMNDIADLIARSGSLSKPYKFKGVSFRRNFSKSNEKQYDLVTNTFGLFDIGKREARLEVLENLWNKVKPNGLLVLAEIGTKHGFSLINEAREFFLNNLIDLNSSEEINNKIGHIFAPCPHQFSCPLLEEGQICRFFSGYRPLDIYDKAKYVEAKEELSYSYIVFKKSLFDKNRITWPRFVYKNPFSSGSKANFWLCNTNGEIEHHISTKQRCKATKKIASYSRIGDCLPAEFEFESSKYFNNNDINKNQNE